MKIKPEELTANSYFLLGQVAHKELVPFLQKYIKKRTKYSVSYYLSNLLLFGLAGYFVVEGFGSPGFEIADRLTQLAYGFAIAFALMPLHEYIHVLAYKSQGAQNTSYDANLKEFYFMALADKFVANKREFEVVALAPFVIITVALTILAFVVHPHWTITVVGTLLMHAAMCSGDFGLLSYFEFNNDQQVVTYDDVEDKITYFYGRTDERGNTA